MSVWADTYFHLETRDNELEKDEIVVVTLDGANAYGEKVYCCVSMTLEQLRLMRAAIAAKRKFLPTDFGTVVAAGKGTIPIETEMEISHRYQTVPLPPLRP